MAARRPSHQSRRGDQREEAAGEQSGSWKGLALNNCLMTDLYHVRNEFQLYQLDEADVQPDPFHLFDRWLSEAVTSGEPEPTAMSVATVSDEGQPSSRIVLLKSFDTDGLTFFTNFRSRKGTELSANPKVSLLFFWPLTQRQVRVEGMARQVDPAESDRYFLSRPEGSRISSVASPQSQAVASRRELEQIYFDVANDRESWATRPTYWGGYSVSPFSIEFWQGRENRLHDRILYAREKEGSWKISRLAP